MASEESRDGASEDIDASEGGDDGNGRGESAQQANRRYCHDKGTFILINAHH